MNHLSVQATAGAATYPRFMPRRLPLLALSLLVAIVGGCQAARISEPTTAASAAAAPAPWYEPEIAAFEAEDRASPPPPGQALFIGSSSIRMWSSLAQDMTPMPVLNRGFGGSKTGEVLDVFDRIVAPYRPSVIVYYCGDNDLGTDNTDSLAAAHGFITFSERARALWPGIEVFYIPIKASPARWRNWAAMSRANEIVRAYCAHTPGATYLDTVTPTLDANGKPDPRLFRKDGLHLNERGYALWTAVIRPQVLDAWERRTSGAPTSDPP